MSTHHVANDAAFRRVEATYLREPEPPACDECGEPTRDGAALCEGCAPAEDDDLVSADGSEGE